MEAICSSETSVASQQTTRRHIPEDDNLKKIIFLAYELGNSGFSDEGNQTVVPESKLAN
jgi:hypothetical protein